MVRKAGKEDLEILAQLAVLLWSQHSVQALRNEFSEVLATARGVFFLKLDREKPVGFAQCQLRHDYVEGTGSSPVGYLEGIFVQPEYRRRGYGKELLRACENWASAMGCKEFASDCQLDNEASYRFHLRAGFSEANRIICLIKKL